jgi:ubiquinone biosynthesis protein
MGETWPLFDFIARLWEVMSAALRWLFRLTHRRLRRAPLEGPKLLRELCERLSGSFLKFGQILSLQIDSLPRAYCDELLALLDRVPAFPREHVDSVFLQEFKKLPSDLYAEFEYVPVASASIGQVHRAVLPDGAKVAVKVQRPGIRRKFVRDLQLMEWMVKFILFFRVRRGYFLRDAVRELSTWTLDELDYRREASYCELLRDNAVQTPTERVPRVHWDLTTARVLTMDYLEGPSVAEYLRMVDKKDQAGLAALAAQGFVPAQFSTNVISNFLSDAFRFGVFHADLHPANLLILPGNVVGYVDFGIVAILTAEARHKQIELTRAYSSGDAESIYQGFLNICMVGEEADLPGLRRRIQALTRSWYHEPSISGHVQFRVNFTQTMTDMLSICQHYGVLVDREMIKYIRSVVLADGLVSRLAPEVDLAQILRRVVEDYVAEEGRRRFFSRASALELLTEAALWLEAGPREFLYALRRFERGELRIHTGTASVRDPNGLLRTRAISTAAVWAVVVVGLAFEGVPAMRASPMFAVLAVVFAALLTLRLLRLLHRMA